MDNPPTRGFGKRVPAVISPASEPVKRSHHVALLVMGTLAVGGGAYALIPRENCTPQAATTCNSSSNSGRWSSHTSFFYGGNSAASGPSTASGSTDTTRGGFGGFGRAFAAHFSGS